MVFQKGSFRAKAHLVFSRISSPGNFTFSLEHFHDLFSLRRHTDFSKLKPSLASKIFDTMISPILTDNSEVWPGCLCENQFLSHGITPESKKLIYTFVNDI